MILSAQITVILLHKLSLHNRKQPFPSHYWPLQHQYWPVWHHILLFWAAGPGVLNRLQKIAEGNLKPAIEAIWWHEAAGLFLKRVVIWSLLGGGGVKSNRRIWPTGVKANRIAPSPTADQSEAPYFHDATGASVRSRWTSSIMCGRPNGTEVGSVVCAHRLHQPALHYRVISSKTWSRDEDNQAHLWEAGTSLIHPTAVSNQ